MADSNNECEGLKDFRIPDHILVPESKVENVPYWPLCPVIVFINSKSGGQLGGDLLVTFCDLLGENQVFDLGKEGPDKVLSRIYVNLEKLKLNGDKFAVEIEKRLRLIVAGGDGTAGWLLGVVCDLKLSRPPPIATIPLGTGNNLPYAFGWGKKNPGTDRRSAKSFLDQVKRADEMKMDNWHILMRMRAPKEGSCDPIPPLELPHSLHAFHRVSEADEMNVEGCHTFRGGFWNYFSMGMDAQVSYAFHSERKLHPEKFKNQLINQSTYMKLGCTQGWFLPPVSHPSGNIAQLAKVMIMKKPGQWEELHIPPSIRSIVCLNLPSFSGGLNPWGTPSRRQRNKDFTPPYVDDGLLEIVGFNSAWHGLILLAPNGHGTRLAQAHRIRFEFHKGASDCTYMRIDGEPWKQPLPVDDDTVVVEISHLGQVNILANPGCRAKSIHKPSANSHHGAEEEDTNEENWIHEGSLALLYNTTMSVTLESLAAIIPNGDACRRSLPSKMTPMVASLRFTPLIGPRGFRVPFVAKGVSPKGLGVRLLSVDRRSSLDSRIVASAASHEESNINIGAENNKDDPNLRTEETQEAWQQVLDSFREQAVKMQGISHEAFEIYSKKAAIILKETSEQLKIQADKARQDLSVIAKEVGEEGRVYISTAAENSPEPVKEIVETYTDSTRDLSEISRAHDFHVGIPYGLYLSLGGFLSFMLTGSTSGIRFGIILGGTLLALSISSLKSYKKGEQFPLAVKGQTAIASILFLREFHRLSQGPSLLSLLNTLISGAVVAFYVYKITRNGKKQRDSNLESQTEN